MKLSRALRTASLVLIALFGFSAVANADFILRIENTSTGQGAVITDGAAGDSNSTLGAITFIGSINGFVVNVTTGISKPVIGGVNNYSELDLNSVNVQGAGPGVLRITLEDTGFVNGPDGPVAVQGDVGGTLTAPAGSSVTFNTWANPNNLVPALGPNVHPVGALGAIGGIPAGSVAAFGSGVIFGPGAYAASESEGFLKLGQYALFSQATISFTGPGTVSFDLNTQAVPEPSTLLLLGSGFLGAAAWVRRRSRGDRV